MSIVIMPWQHQLNTLGAIFPLTLIRSIFGPHYYLDFHALRFRVVFDMCMICVWYVFDMCESLNVRLKINLYNIKL